MNTKQSVAQLAVPHRKRLSSTMVVALLLCVVAGAVMINAADFPATAIETDPGASAFPTFYACALIVLAVLLVIRDLLQAKPASCANAQEKPAFRKTATGIAATAFYIVAMSYCGYLITTPVFLIVIMTLMGYRRWVLTPGIALLLTAILWLLFVEALQGPAMFESELLTQGFSTLLNNPQALLFATFGVMLGIVIGALPGLTATMGVAILLPFTYGMEPVSGLLMICGVFFGGVYGGSITAILLKIPGTPAAAATAIDGYELTKQGKAGLALSAATFSSFSGGTLSIIVLMFLSPVLASWALKFSASESFALATFGLSIIASISGESLIKGLIAGVGGLLIATIGLDPMGGFPRFTGGFVELMNVPFIPVMIGLFAASEAFRSMEQNQQIRQGAKVAIGSLLLPWQTLRRIALTILRSSGLGVFIGMIPGAGADIAAFVAYNETRRFSKTPENFGKGEIKAVASCEAGANGCTGGALLPMLTLGIPGDAVTAIMLGALTLQGMQPGPLMFTDHGDMVYTLFVGMIFCYFMLLVLGLLSLKVIGNVVKIPGNILTPMILALCVVGTYALNNSLFDVGIMLIAGVVGYFMQKGGYPASPVVLALIMGPMAESNFRRALSLSGGSLDFLYTRPITLALLTLAAFTLLTPIIRKIMRLRRQ
ncbi:TPA: tripartite tricarboxylate transporter permease [Escherichia coli]|nr:tripartite tricarboxylate transporter permease [Escherichia coli]